MFPYQASGISGKSPPEEEDGGGEDESLITMDEIGGIADGCIAFL